MIFVKGVVDVEDLSSLNVSTEFLKMNKILSAIKKNLVTNYFEMLAETAEKKGLHVRTHRGKERFQGRID